MSWASDEGIDAFFETDTKHKSVEAWKYKKHIDKNGKEYKFSDLEDSHLINIYKKFDGIYDMQPILEEIESRNLLDEIE